MLANVKEEHLSPTTNHHPNHHHQYLNNNNNGQQQPTTTSSANSASGGGIMMMNKEEVQMNSNVNNNNTPSSSSTTTSSNNMMNHSMPTPNVIPPNYQSSTNGIPPHQENQQHGYYPPIHQPPPYGYGPYGHHPYPSHQQPMNTLPSLNSTGGPSYGMPTNTIEGYAPNPQTSNPQHQVMQNPPPQYNNNNMENVQTQGNVHQQQQMYQQQIPPSSQNTAINNGIPSSAVNNTTQPAVQNTSSTSTQQQTVAHTIFHEYQTHKKSGSPVNDNNSGEYHPIACIPCRKRHKKCDRLLPKCSECGKRGIDCQYYEPKQKGRKKKDDAPGSPQPSSPTNNTQSEQYSTPQTPTTNYNFQQQQPVPPFNQQPASTPENSPASLQTRERSASYQKYRSEPYPNVNRSDIQMYNNGMNSSTSNNVTPQRERAVSSASSSNYFSSSPYFNGMNSQASPMQNGLPNIKTNSTPTMNNNQYMQQPNRSMTSSSSPDSSNDANLPPYARFVPIEKDKLKEQLYIRRGEFESWDTFRVAQWIDTLDASFPSHNVGELFKHHDIDGLAFLGLHNQILLEMGIAKVGVRLRLVRIIDHLRLQN